MILALILSLVINALAFWVASKVVECWTFKDLPTSAAVAAGYSLLITVFFALRIGVLICSLPLISLLPAWIVTGAISYALTAAIVFAMAKYSLVDDFKLTTVTAAAQGCAVVTITQVCLGFVVSHIL